MKLHNYQELKRLLTATELEEVQRRVDEAVAQHSLRSLRERRGITQTSIGARMSADQGSISKLERRGDFSVSTLRRYIEALGGRLSVRAVFPDENIELDVGSVDGAGQSMTSSVEAAHAERTFAEALQASSWDPYDPQVVRRHVGVGGTIFDAVLTSRDNPVAVIVKRSPAGYEDVRSLSQAAQEIGASIVLFTSGERHWASVALGPYKAERIQRFPDPSDVERFARRSREVRIPLSHHILRGEASDVDLLPHQVDCIRKVAGAYDSGQRHFLVSMAPGTGKSGVFAGLVKACLESRHAERILVIVDRLEKAQQYGASLVSHGVPSAAVIRYGSAAMGIPVIGPCVLIATVAAISRNARYKNEWSPLAFDLVVDIDANRASHVVGRDVIQYFFAPRLGIISGVWRLLSYAASLKLGMRDPRARELRKLRDTYAFFGCKPGFPTALYDFDDVANEPNSGLILPTLVDARVAFSTIALAQNGWDQELAERESASQVRLAQKRIFTEHRNRAMVRHFLDCAAREDDGTIGRSVVFALNHEHAIQLTEIFNKFLTDGTAMSIMARTPNAYALARDFAAGRLKPRVAVGVDLLASGLPYRNLRNVGIMRPVFSAREYELLKGCAVRLTTEAGDREPTLLIDVLRVAEYFGEKYDLCAATRMPMRTSVGPSVGRPRSLKYLIAQVRTAFETGVRELYEADSEFRVSVDAAEDDLVEKVLVSKLLGRPPGYSGMQVAAAYGVPAPLAAMVYDVLGKAKLPGTTAAIKDTVTQLSARFDLTHEQERLLEDLVETLLKDKRELKSFMEGSASILLKTRFRRLGVLRSFTEPLLDALREAPLLHIAPLIAV